MNRRPTSTDSYIARAALRLIILAAALTLSSAAQAAPEPKVAVVFDVTNDAQLLVAPAVVDMSADAFARQQNHPIVAVEFYNGTTLVGTANASPYQFAWRNVPAGSYSLTAKAINDKGEFANSPPVSVFVDAAPSVALTAPSAHSIVNGMTGILLTANATDSDGSIAKVEFYHGATLIRTKGVGVELNWHIRKSRR